MKILIYKNTEDKYVIGVPVFSDVEAVVAHTMVPVLTAEGRMTVREAKAKGLEYTKGKYLYVDDAVLPPMETFLSWNIDDTDWPEAPDELPITETAGETV